MGTTQAITRHHGLDAIRGLCALTVACYHFLDWQGLGQFSSMGTYTVYAFFILSALTLCMVYGPSFGGGDVKRNALLRYGNHRIARILPLLAAVSLLSFAVRVLHIGQGEASISKFLLTATGFFALSPAGTTANAIAAWSLGPEILFYLIFPVLCLVLLPLKTARLAGVTLACFVMQNLYIAHVLAGTTVADAWGLYVAPVSFCFYFVSGFLIYRIREKIPKNMGVLGFLLVAFAIYSSIFWHGSATELLLFPVGVMAPLILTAGIMLIYSAEVKKLPIAPLEFLGKISYSSYLLHPFVYFGVLKITAHFGLSVAWVAGLFAVILLCLSYASYELFEMPARRIIRKRLDKAVARA